MKKYFLSLGFCFCAVGIGFGAWKFQVHKKLPWGQGRVPASVQEAVLKHDEHPAAENEELVESQPAEEAEAAKPAEHKEEFQVKLQKIEKTHGKKSKPVAKAEKREKTLVIVKGEKHDKSKPEQGPATNLVKHTVTQDETAWFLSSVYYGKGQEFEKILAANHFSKAEEMKEGMEIQIPSPKFHKGQSGFAAHYTKIWEKRAKALKERNKDVEADKYLTQAPMPSSKVVIPTEKIRAKDKTPSFPFTEDKQTSPVQKAQEVLRQSHEQHGE